MLHPRNVIVIVAHIVDKNVTTALQSCTTYSEINKQMVGQVREGGRGKGVTNRRQGSRVGGSGGRQRKRGVGGRGGGVEAEPQKT